MTSKRIFNRPKFTYDDSNGMSVDDQRAAELAVLDAERARSRRTPTAAEMFVDVMKALHPLAEP